MLWALLDDGVKVDSVWMVKKVDVEDRVDGLVRVDVEVGRQ